MGDDFDGMYDFDDNIGQLSDIDNYTYQGDEHSFGEGRGTNDDSRSGGGGNALSSSRRQSDRSQQDMHGSCSNNSDEIVCPCDASSSIENICCGKNPDPAANEQHEDEGESDGLGGRKKKYKNSDGSERDYDAPAPPGENEVHWGQVDKLLDDWIICKTASPRLRRKRILFGLHGDHRFSLMEGGYPEEDYFLLEDTAQSVREVDEVLLPFAILADGKTIEESPKWSMLVEEYLRSRGIKLADSFAIKTASKNGLESMIFGVRAFHVGFRYFMFVVLGDVESTEDGKLTKIDGCPFVSYYYVSITKEQAISNECP